MKISSPARLILTYSFVLLLVIMYSRSSNASEVQVCFVNAEATKQLSDFRDYQQWQLYQSRIFLAANQLRCEKLETFRDTISGTIIYLTIFNGIIINYTPFLQAKAFVVGSIGFLTNLNILLKQVPCDKGEENFKRAISEGICEAAEESNGVFACDFFNSDFILPIEWENGMNYKKACNNLQNTHGLQNTLTLLPRGGNVGIHL